MKVFICSDTEFPHKGATSNYIEILAKAISMNAETYVVAISYKPENCIDWVQYGDFFYKTILYNVSNKRNTIQARLSIGNEMWRCIEQRKTEAEDSVICYTNNFFLIKSIYANVKQREMGMINCVTEWHIAKQYKYAYLDVFNYWYYNMAFYWGVGISKKVIVISKKLEEHFKKRGCKVLLMPALIDSFQEDVCAEKSCGKIKFIYSGSYENKDSMQVMLNAFAKLPDDMRTIVEFHITGRSNEGLYKIAGVSLKTWESVEQTLVVHPWMEYSDLIDLYKQMHFGLIVREKNRATLSNFPSKVPEMMWQGIIPIMTKVGDLPTMYLEDGKDSILFEECTVESCMNAIIRAVQMSKSERERMERNARDRAKNCFGYEKWMDSIDAFICDRGIKECGYGVK